MAKEIKYNSVAERLVTERDSKQVLLMLISILEDRDPGFFEEGLNKLYPQANGEQYSATVTKPQ